MRSCTFEGTSIAALVRCCTFKGTSIAAPVRFCIFGGTSIAAPVRFCTFKGTSFAVCLRSDAKYAVRTQAIRVPNDKAVPHRRAAAFAKRWSASAQDEGAAEGAAVTSIGVVGRDLEAALAQAAPGCGFERIEVQSGQAQ